MAYRVAPQGNGNVNGNFSQNTVPSDHRHNNNHNNLNSLNSILDLDPTNVFGQNVFGHPLPLPQPTPPNPTALNLGQQQQSYTNHQLPSLPNLFTRFYGSPDPAPSAFSPHVPRNPSPSAAGYNFSQRPAALINPAFPFSSPDANPNLSSRYSTFNSFGEVNPPGGFATQQTQQPRSSSSAIHNTHGRFPQPNRSIPELTSEDHFLLALAEAEFSSPSLPPINSSPLPPTRPQSSNLPKPLEVGEAMSTAGHRRQRGSKGRLVDLTKEEPDLDSPSGIDHPTLTMPSTRKRSRPATNGESQPPAKRRRISGSSPSTSGRVIKPRGRQTSNNQSAISPFTDDEFFNPAADEEGHDGIDLCDAAEVPEELKAPKVDTRTKIGKFQCVICMDDASSLTVTHCGHLFCSECLHSALHIDNMKKTCPVCRTKVDPKEKKGKNQKSFYHLELKIMTANKKGKRRAGSFAA